MKKNRGERFPAKQKLNQEDFLFRAREIHGDKYDYKNSVYEGYKKNIDILCEKHGVFTQRVSDHLSNKTGCPECYSESRKTWTEEEELFLRTNYGKKGFNSKVIAETLGKTRDAVLVHSRRLGLSRAQKPFVGNFPRHVWNNTKKRAKVDKIEINISEEYLNQILVEQDYFCAISGTKLVSSNDTKLNTVSVDRINSSIGYVEGNIQIVHRTFNVLKWNHNEIDLIEMCEMVATHLKKRYAKLEWEWDIMNDTEIPVKVYKGEPILEKDMHKKIDGDDLF